MLTGTGWTAHDVSNPKRMPVGKAAPAYNTLNKKFDTFVAPAPVLPP